MSEDKDDIFKRAAAQSLNEVGKLDKEAIPVPVENYDDYDEEEISQSDLALYQSEEGDKWDNLSEFVTGAGATRLLTELKAMPSKDYVRNYLKLLEHFKPKLVRSQISPGDEEDRVIQVNMMQKMPDGEIRTITINKK